MKYILTVMYQTEIEGKSKSEAIVDWQESNYDMMIDDFCFSAKEIR